MLRRFRDLVDEHQHRVYSFSYYYLGDRAEAEDVTQEVLLRLWHHVDRVEPESAAAWLSKVTRNACFDSLRRRRSERKVMAVDLEPDDTPEPVDEHADPLADTEAREVVQRFRKALEAVEEPQRSIVILREVQGMKYRHIADATGLPLNTVKTYLHRARRKLREQLEEVRDYARTH